jgi:hypothetical protein
VALAAAYALALSALMPGVAGVLLSAGSAGGATIVCSGGGTGEPADADVPAKPNCPCDSACMMPACVGGACGGLAESSFAHGVAAAAPIKLGHESPWPPALRLGSGNLARGPPAV